MSKKITDKILKLREKIEAMERQVDSIQKQADFARTQYEEAYKESEQFRKKADDLFFKALDCDTPEESGKLSAEKIVAEIRAETLEKSSEKAEEEADKLDDKAQKLKFKAMDLRTEMENLKRERNDEMEKRRREKEYSDFNAFMERENERIRQRVSGENIYTSNISAQVTPKPYEPPEPPERKHLPVLAYDYKQKSFDKPKSYDGNFSEVDPGLAALYNDERAGYEENTYIFKENYGNKKRRDKHDIDDDFNFDD